MKIKCPHCGTELDVGDESRSIVAICYRANKTCEVKQWGSPKTRVWCMAEDDGQKEGGGDNPTHVLQTDPPDAGEEWQPGLPFDQTVVDEGDVGGESGH